MITKHNPKFSILYIQSKQSIYEKDNLLSQIILLNDSQER